MKTLEEIDSDLVDIIWSLLDYPELKEITDKLTILEEELDAKVNPPGKRISEAEARSRM